MSRKSWIVVPDMPEAGPYAHAVRVDEILYTSCIPPLDRNGAVIAPGDIAAQARHIYEQLARILAASGASWADVAKVHHFFSPPGPSAEELEALRAIVAEHLPPGQQAATEICFGLAHAGARLQVELIAHIGVPKRPLAAESGGKRSSWAAGVRVGRHVYIGNQRACDAAAEGRAPLTAETAQIYGAFDRLLAEAGMGWRDLVRVRQFVTDRSADFNQVRDGRISYVPVGSFTSTSVSCHEQDPARPGGQPWLIAADLEATAGTRIAANTSALPVTLATAHAVKVGHLVHLQAEIADDPTGAILYPGDIEAQTRYVLQSMDKLLQAAACSWSDVVISRVFCRDREHLETVRRLERHRARDAVYARTDLVARFFDPEVLLEIELTAACP